MIQIQRLDKSYPQKIIYENASLNIYENECVGLIGRNGIGKSTLFEILVNNIGYEGNINKSNDIKFGYYTQDLYLDENLTVNDILYKPFEHLFAMEEKMLELSYDFENNADEYTKLYEQFELDGGFFITTNINLMINKFKLSHILNQTVDTLSGGQKGRVALAKVLLSKPDLLLLDEPLNHLDIEAIEWLEGFLQNNVSTFILISHDRYFINNVCNTIVEVKQHQFFKYSGNYDAYLKQSGHNLLSMQNEYEKQQREITKMKSQIKQYRIWGAARDSEKMYKKAKEVEKRLAKLDILDNPNVNVKNMRINFNEAAKTGYNVMWAENVAIGYDKPLISDITFDIYQGDRVAIVGPNGTGKSTLLKIMADKLKILSGEFKLGANVKHAYFDQIFENLDKSKTVIDEIHSSNILLTNYQLRSHLAKFLFRGDELDKQVSLLSGGECVRVALAKLSLEESNVLLLDEPTNHLDLESKAIIEEALLGYSGTIIFSSHDRYFINKVATKIFEFSNDGFRVINTTYDKYVMEKAVKYEVKKPKPTGYEDNKKRRSLEQKKERIEAEIDQLSNLKKELENKKFDYDVYTSSDEFEQLELDIKNYDLKIENLINKLCSMDE